MQCPGCRRTIPAAAGFCAYCGYRAADTAAPARRRARRRAIGSVLLAVLLVALVGGGFELVMRDRVYPRVQVVPTGVDVGGQTQAGAGALLAPFSKVQRFRRVTLRAPGSTPIVRQAFQLGYSLDGGLTWRRAYAVGRTGSAWQRFTAQVHTLVAGTKVVAAQRIDQRLLRDNLFYIAAGLDRPPRPGVAGRGLNILAAQRALTRGLLAVGPFAVRLTFHTIPALPRAHAAHPHAPLHRTKAPARRQRATKR